MSFHPDAMPFHHALTLGKRRAIAWGLSATLPYRLVQSSYPFIAVIDSNPGAWGCKVAGIPVIAPSDLASFDPADTVVVVMADFGLYGEAIVQAVAAQGPFPVITPLEFDTLPDLLPLVTAPTSQAWPADGSGAGEAAGWRDVPAAFGRVLAEVVRPRTADAPLPAVPGHACLLIGSLSPGGAERQIAYLGAGLRRRGWRVTVLSFYPPMAGAENYVRLLEAAGAELLVLPSARAIWGTLTRADWQRWTPALRLGCPLASFMQHAVVAVQSVLEERKADVLFTYLDANNLVGGMAGLLAGTPRIVMSGRNLNPTHFPGMVDFCSDGAALPQLFRRMLNCPGVTMTNNSRAGAQSYASWLGVEEAAIPVVANAVDVATLKSVDRKAGERWRRHLGLGPDQPVVVGAMRLAPEKAPLRFLEVIRRLRDRLPDVHAILLGDGPLRAAVEDARDALGLDGTVTLMGARADVYELMLAGNLLLQTSTVEGMPNVVLEAQSLGRAVVATAAGGTVECLTAPLRPYVQAGQPDRLVDGLVSACTELLSDRRRAAALGAEAAALIARDFSIERMTEATLAVAGLA
ncbi:hypothetical protein CHT98_21635 (plasmid) [Azospirillum brasilense]|uniref:Glycosyltransferase n=1 Tax=Azospirillum brasilense TaxID=192 RepID=A0A235HA10_AZOBR|nr:hypothetical protein CHT98_21635 [Azospirillum brasilense]